MRKAVVLACGIMFVTAACNSPNPQPNDSAATTDTTIKDPGSAPFGRATISPRQVAHGDQFSLRPDGAVQPICGGLAELFLSADTSDLRSIGQLGHESFTDRSETTPTWPACLPPKSDQAATFVVPDGLPGGRYVVCITMPPDPAGCGELEVSAG